MKNRHTLDMIEKEIRIRNRTTPFQGGLYKLKNPLFIFLNPKICLQFNRKGNKAVGELWIWNYRKKLRCIYRQEYYVVYQFQLDIINIDMVLNFYQRDAFEGFFDTPLGHIRFAGKYERSDYGGNYENR